MAFQVNGVEKAEPTLDLLRYTVRASSLPAHKIPAKSQERTRGCKQGKGRATGGQAQERAVMESAGSGSTQCTTGQQRPNPESIG